MKYIVRSTGASLSGGIRPREWTKTSGSNDDAAAGTSVQEQGPVEKADPGAAVSSTPDSVRHKGPEFSWKLEDLRNWKFFKDEVKMIPTTFTSVEGYMGSFIAPLLEEARVDLCSALESIRHAPVAEVIRIEGSGAGHSSDQSNLRIWFKEPRAPVGCYAPKGEDILVLASRKPRDYKDLDPFVIAVVPRDTCEDTPPESKDAQGTTSSSRDQDNVTSSEDKATANTSFQAEPTTTVSVGCSQVNYLSKNMVEEKSSCCLLLRYF